MTLFVFEGKKTEIQIYETLKTLYPEKFRDDSVICTFCTNIFMLYKEMEKLNKDFPDSADFLFVLQNYVRKKKDIPEEYRRILDIKNPDEISETYLFFDFDIQDDSNNATLEDKMKMLADLTNYFCQEDDNGKLYISYPMVEAFKYLKSSCDYDFLNSTIPLSACNKSFKTAAKDYCYNKNLSDFICRKNNNLAQNDVVRNTWKYIVDFNARKANRLCNDSDDLPAKNYNFKPNDILAAQKIKFIDNGELAVLSGFGVFLFEY